jgi:hypothetical protein
VSHPRGSGSTVLPSTFVTIGPNIERYQAAVQLLNMERERLFAMFSAFLVAQAVIGGLLANAIADDGNGWLLIGGAVFGLLLAVLWLSALLRNLKSHDFRQAQVRRDEPDGWNLMKGEGEHFAAGCNVTVDHAKYQLKGLAGWTIRQSAQALVALFMLGYVTILVVGIERAA